MASGINVCQDSIDKYLEMKEKHNMSYLVLKIHNNEVVTDKVGEEGASFEEFRAYLEEVKTQHEARYCFFDFPHNAAETKNKTGKLALILWSSDDIQIKQKMIYTSSLAAVKKACSGFAKCYELHDLDELEEGSLRKDIGVQKKGN